MKNHLCSLQQILISNLLINASVGINPEELKNKQPILISLVLETTVYNTYEVNNIVNYSIIIIKIKDIVASKHFDLLEELCSLIGQECLDIANVKSVQIEISKPKLCLGCDKISVKQNWK